MEWLIIPGILATIFAILLLWSEATVWHKALSVVLCYLAGTLFLGFAISCPNSYYSTRTNALSAEVYYQEILLPHKVGETDTHIVVSSQQAAIWQAGEMNLPKYNSYLKTTRYWDSVPIIGTAIYSPPKYLKYARIGNE